MRYNCVTSSVAASALLVYSLVWASPLVPAQTASGTTAQGAAIFAQYLYAAQNVSGTSHGAIAGFRIASDGTLTSVGEPFLIGSQPRQLVASAWGRKLFGVGDDRLWSFAVDPLTGRLKLLQVLHFPDHGAQHGLNLGINPKSTLLFVSKFIIGPTFNETRITTYRIAGNGMLTKIASTVVPQLFTLDKESSLAVDPTGRFLYVKTVLSSKASITQLKINEATGALTVVGSFPLRTAQFSGDLAVHGARLYQSSTLCPSLPECHEFVSVFAISSISGSPTEIQGLTCDCNDEPRAGGIIAVTPKRNLLYEVTFPNSVAANGIAVFAVDATTGRLTPQPQSFLHTEVNIFTTEGTGKFLFTTGPERTVSSYAIDNAGALTPIVSVPIPSNVEAVPILRVVTVRQ